MLKAVILVALLRLVPRRGGGAISWTGSYSTDGWDSGTCSASGTSIFTNGVTY